MAEVTIYATMFCGYCAAAKRLLAKKGIAFEEIDVAFTRGARDEMVARAGGRTSVPQIFIGETHVGGFDDLAELEQDGELDPLLQAE
jgi:glutaredoxin 3